MDFLTRPALPCSWVSLHVARLIYRKQGVLIAKTVETYNCRFFLIDKITIEGRDASGEAGHDQ